MSSDILWDGNEWGVGTAQYYCDTCGAVDDYDIDDGDVKDAWSRAKSDGWRAFMKGNDWQHKCPECGGFSN